LKTKEAVETAALANQLTDEWKRKFESIQTATPLKRLKSDPALLVKATRQAQKTSRIPFARTADAFAFRGAAGQGFLYRSHQRRGYTGLSATSLYVTGLQVRLF